MALQALPRHSRVLLERPPRRRLARRALELRAVHNAVIAHEEKLQAAAKKRGEAANANTSDMETRHAHEANAVHLELDSESEDDGGDAGDGERRRRRRARDDRGGNARAAQPPGSKVFKLSFAVNALVRRGSKTFEAARLEDRRPPSRGGRRRRRRARAPSVGRRRARGGGGVRSGGTRRAAAARRRRGGGAEAEGEVAAMPKPSVAARRPSVTLRPSGAAPHPASGERGAAGEHLAQGVGL